MRSSPRALRTVLLLAVSASMAVLPACGEEADDGTFTTTLTPGSEVTRTFDEAGTFGYTCAEHPEMTGTITVT